MPGVRHTRTSTLGQNRFVTVIIITTTMRTTGHDDDAGYVFDDDAITGSRTSADHAEQIQVRCLPGLNAAAEIRDGADRR